MRERKSKEAKKFEIDGKYYLKVIEKQKEDFEKREIIFKKMLESNFGKEESQSIYKKFDGLFKLCEQKGENEEAIRVIVDDFTYFDEFLGILRERSKVKINFTIDLEKLKEDLEKKGKELEEKMEVQKRIVMDILKEGVKYKAERDKYERVINEILFRKRNNIKNIMAIKDFQREKVVGEKLVDMVMSNRLKLILDYGIYMRKRIK